MSIKGTVDENDDTVDGCCHKKRRHKQEKGESARNLALGSSGVFLLIFLRQKACISMEITDESRLGQFEIDC
jgi:hypothetical protein